MKMLTDILNRYARELLITADEFNEWLNELDKNEGLAQKDIVHFKEFLEKTYTALTIFKGILEEKNSSLSILIYELAGGKFCADEKKNMEYFLESHKEMLNDIGVPEETSKQLVVLFENEIKKIKLEEPLKEPFKEPQTITIEDGEGFIKAIVKFRGTICQMSSIDESLQQQIDLKILSECVQGLRGVCLIVVNVVAAFKSSDITGSILLKAVIHFWIWRRLFGREGGDFSLDFKCWCSVRLLKPLKVRKPIQFSDSPGSDCSC